MSYSNGYTCAYCGQWVPSGWVHSCSTWPYPQRPPTARFDATFQWLAIAQQLVAALEQIADSLGAYTADQKDTDQ